MSIPTPGPDRTCLVTGASAGIGVELASQMAARGHGVTLVARREDRLRELADELHAKHGVRAEVVACDLQDTEARSDLVAEVGRRGLAIDVLMNNAGFSTVGPVAEVDPDREVGMIRTNVEAVAHLCALVVPGMVERRRGAILNVASTASFQPLPGQAGYAATKSFVRSYSLALGAELSPHGVSVTALCPGPVDTEFADAAGFDDLSEGEGLPAFMWEPASAVARCGIDALEAGKAVAIPGTANRVFAAAARLTPKALLLPIMRKAHPSL